MGVFTSGYFKTASCAELNASQMSKKTKQCKVRNNIRSYFFETAAIMVIKKVYN